ncbi:NifB/NifX family molybdenum-iron cluster-binding protein [Treponema brennaborense]|uniref:Dinitrogenase iron-molybdenum cofactor biosynthesis protein n=1 Tax=Treponema brennaborense (strain DSM 12168 / CIP 105900 / DD5/3) TaxID=906968 RepID=F4LME7_TREBD|nr:NifB/NifX family molybdenum-iron cluster-binding protein [Treponema brennaborense]AEE15709.1 Dinitrogenase iron-molybdenum cofactor biosynthesis protein [Treponema brennaborense DSM 12168]
MKIAITYENGDIFQHFGKCPSFLIAETDGKSITSSNVVSTNGSGHSALFQFLKDLGVDTVICGGMGQGARDALENGNIRVVAGQSGAAEAALRFFLNGDLKDNPAGKCDHHHEGSAHTCGEHGCK